MRGLRDELATLLLPGTKDGSEIGGFYRELMPLGADPLAPSIVNSPVYSHRLGGQY